MPNGTHSRTNIALNDRLMQRARELSGLKTKREIVDAALKTLIRVELFERLLEKHQYRLDPTTRELRSARPELYDADDEHDETESTQ